MEARFHNRGFAATPASNTFQNFGNSTHVEGVGYGTSYCADTTLRLDSPVSSISNLSTSNGIKRKWSLIGRSNDQQNGWPLCLGLGHSSSSSDSKGSSATVCITTSSAKETDEESSMDLELDFSLHLSNELTPSSKKSGSSTVTVLDERPKFDLELSLFTGSTESDVTAVHPSSISAQNVIKMPPAIGGAFCREKLLTSSYLETGKSFPPLQHSPETSYFLNQVIRELKPARVTPDLSSSILTTPKISLTFTSGITQQQSHRSSSIKTCQFKGCGKGARGASGLCIAHGGGRRCQKPGCHKGAEGRTAYCKAHGGGRRCEFLGCTKSAEGRTDYCIAHGGGRRCSQEGCARAARGKSGLCIRHGGGKRCTKDNCTRSAEGLSGLCISHGGGRRCQYPACTKGAQGSTMFCKAHGGGKRCTFEGCTKGAEGSTPFCKGHGGGKRCAYECGGGCPKSVHGGTLFCVAHGGGKRCATPECTKSARGRTDYCVRHGGGKRCKFGGCSKSAQGRTDFCKAHGGGKRCSWGQPGSEFGKGNGRCNSFARGKSGLCTSHGALVQDKRVHGGATVGVIVQDPKPTNSGNMKEVVFPEEMSVMMGAGCIGSSWRSSVLQVGSPIEQNPLSKPVSISEGRVHGGSLGALLAGSSGCSSKGSTNIVIGPSMSGNSYMMPLNWM